MARALPAGLAAYITAGAHSPALSVTLQDGFVMPRPTFMGAANGASTGRSHAIVTAAGSILRAICTQSGDPAFIAVQRIASPTTPSQWQAAYPAASNFGPVARQKAGVCLTQRSSDNLIFCFYQRPSDNTIVYRSSADDGQTWSAETPTNGQIPAVIAVGFFCYGIAADQANPLNLFTTWANYDPYGAVGFFRTSDNGAWQPWVNDGPVLPATFGVVRGIVTAGNTHDFLAGVQMRQFLSGISAATYHWSGSSFTPLVQFAAQDTGDTGLSIPYPSISFDGNYYWYAITHLDDGSVSGTPQSRTALFGYNAAIGSWQVASLGPAFSYNSNCLHSGGYLYLFDAVSCYQIPFGAALPGPTDVSDDVLEIRITDHLDDPSVVTLVLDNSTGTYNAMSNLQPDAAVHISLGYQGYPLVNTHTASIDQFTFEVAAAKSILVIQARTASRLLDYPSQKYYALANQTVQQIITQLFLLAYNTPFTLIPPAASQFSQTISCFVLNPGETYLAALKRLAAVFGFNFYDDQTNGVSLYQPQSTDSPTWSYASEILGLTYGKSADQANWIRVIGANSGAAAPSGSATVFADWFDQPNLNATGRYRFKQIADRMLTTSAQCLLRAQLDLAQEQRDALYAELAVALNPAHQLLDVISVTDPDIGLTPPNLRITSIDWLISLETGAFEQRLLCSGV